MIGYLSIEIELYWILGFKPLRTPVASDCAAPVAAPVSIYFYVDIKI